MPPILTPSCIRPIVMSPVLTPALAILLGVGAFNPRHLFADPSAVGVHLETYDPNSILRRVNLHTYSEQFDQADWPKVRASVTANATAAPDGSVTADKLVEDTSATLNHYTEQVLTLTQGAAYVTGVNVKAAERMWVCVYIAGPNVGRFFNVGAGAVGSELVGVPDSSAIEAAANGFYRCTIGFTAGATNTVRVYVCNGDASGHVYTGDGVSGIYIHGIQTQRGTAATTYQKVTDWNTEFLAAGGDRVTMFQDTACTTPVTAVEQSIAAIISSERGTARGAAIGTNMDFSSGLTGWTTGVVGSSTVTESGGVVSLNRNGGAANISRALFTVGTTYEVKVRMRGTAGGEQFRLDNGATLGTAINLTTSFQTYTAGIFTATNITCYWNNLTDLKTIEIDSIEVRPLPGKVITQPTSGFQAKLKARVNMFPSSEDFNASSTATGFSRANSGTGVLPTITPNYATTPSGRPATRIQMSLAGGTATGDISWVQTVWNHTLGVSCTQKIWAKSADANSYVVAFDMDNGNSQLITITPAWQQFSVSRVASASGSRSSRLGLRGDVAVSATADIVVSQAEVRTDADWALNVPPYQGVRSASDYDTDGFPHRVVHDGSDDFYSFALNLSTCNKVDVFVDGLLKQSDAAAAVLVEHTASSGVNNGAFGLFGPAAAASATYTARSRGTATSDATGVGFAAPRNDALCMSADISSDVLTLDGNGTQAATSATDQGTGNYANDTCYIAARAGTSLRSGIGWTAITIVGSPTANVSAGKKAQRVRWGQRKAKII